MSVAGNRTPRPRVYLHRLLGHGVAGSRGEAHVHTDSFGLHAAVPGRVLALSGRLDVHAAADARLELADAVDAGEGDLVLDLTALEAVDPTGLGVLVGAHRRAGRNGRTLVLRDTPPAIGRLLRLTRLDRVLRQTMSTDAAYT